MHKKTSEKQKIAEKIMREPDPLENPRRTLKKLKNLFENAKAMTNLENYTNDARLLIFELYFHTRMQIKEKYKSIINASRHAPQQEFHKQCLQHGMNVEQIILIDIIVGDTMDTAYDNLIALRNIDRKAGTDSLHKRSRLYKQYSIKYCKTNPRKSQNQCAKDIHNKLLKKNKKRKQNDRPEIKVFTVKTITSWLTGVKKK